MSYYFVIVGSRDNPLFEHEFGTSRQGGDGIARFKDEERHMNQFIVHSSLDVVEEVQWAGNQMYLKCIDRFYNCYISCFMTGGNVKFLLLHDPQSAMAAGSAAGASARSTSVAANPTSAATEEAIRLFFADVYEIWVRLLMNPFYHVDMEVSSPIFRNKVAAAGKKYL